MKRGMRAGLLDVGLCAILALFVGVVPALGDISIVRPPNITDQDGAPTESDLFKKHIHEIALKLAGAMNHSDGAPAVVRDFVEIRTKRRLLLSHRIEAELSSSLTQIGALTIVVVPAETTSVLSGFYEAETNGDVWVIVKLVRLADHVTEARAEGTIPKAALTEDEMRELDLAKSAPAQGGSSAGE